MAQQNQQPEPVVIVKKTGGHGGHHGGAWKVAYADFVTAMMALFIVLWLMNSSKEVKDSVSGYFNDPEGFSKKLAHGRAGGGGSTLVSRNDMQKLGETLAQSMNETPELVKIKDNVQFIVTAEGLRIELLESEKGVFFNSGSPRPSATGEEMLAMLARELAKLPNHLVIEGHTDARPFARDGYTNWELSADRANSARRLMRENGLREAQVKQVRGFADQQLRRRDAPEDASNRRISVIVQYPGGVAPEAAASPEKERKPPAATAGH